MNSIIHFFPIAEKYISQPKETGVSWLSTYKSAYLKVQLFHIVLLISLALWREETHVFVTETPPRTNCACFPRARTPDGR